MQQFGTESLSETLTELSIEFLKYESNSWRLWSNIAFDDSVFTRVRDEREYISPHYPWTRVWHERHGKFFTSTEIVHPITWCSVRGLIPLLQALLRCLNTKLTLYHLHAI